MILSFQMMYLLLKLDQHNIQIFPHIHQFSNDLISPRVIIAYDFL